MARAGEMGMTNELHLIRDHHPLYDVSWEVLPRVHPMEAVVQRRPRLHGKLIAGFEKKCIELSQMVLILKDAGVPEKDWDLALRDRFDFYLKKAGKSSLKVQPQWQWRPHLIGNFRAVGWPPRTRAGMVCVWSESIRQAVCFISSRAREMELPSALAPRKSKVNPRDWAQTCRIWLPLLNFGFTLVWCDCAPKCLFWNKKICTLFWILQETVELSWERKHRLLNHWNFKLSYTVCHWY